MSQESDTGIKIPRWITGMIVTFLFMAMGWRVEDNRRDRIEKMDQMERERTLEFKLRDTRIKELRRRIDALESNRSSADE